MSPQQKRMGGLGKLSDFGRTPPVPQEQPIPPETPVESKRIRPLDDNTIKSLESNPITSKPKELVTVNIKISRTQQDWLSDTARQVRDNNTSPVPPSERVYPQHLIQVAVDLLQNADLDWSQIRNVEELKQHLNL